MKFTEEEAYNELVAELKKKEANPLINKRGIQDIIKDDFLLLGESEIELSDYVAKRINSVKSVDGNIRKVAKTTIEDYKKTLEQELKVEPSAEPKANEPNDALKAMQEQLAAMQAKFEQAEKQNVLASKTKNLKAKMEELGIKDKEWTNDFLSEVNIDGIEDIEAKAQSYLKIYNKQRANIDETFTPQSVGGTSKDDEDFFKRERERREKLKENEKQL